MAAAVVTLAGLAGPAHALNFVFTDVSQGGAMSAVQLAAFQTAATYWESRFSDPTTVYIDIAFDDLGPNILGGTRSTFTTANYSDVRTALTLDATSALDAVAVANLQAGPALAFQATQGNLRSRYDDDGSTNNTLLGLTTANAKAMGLTVGTGAGNADANITFATGFADVFDYTRDGVTGADEIDFITVAQHEIGHALGFTSGVDDIDYCAGFAGARRCGLRGVDRFEDDWWYEPLDLFRFSEEGLMDVRVGQDAYFSVDGGATAIESFSTGSFHGNGWQASHFGPDVQNLMRPFVGDGEAYDATYADLAAFDAIGWNVAAVPEPGTYAMMLLGLAGVASLARRRRARGPTTPAR